MRHPPIRSARSTPTPASLRQTRPAWAGMPMWAGLAALLAGCASPLPPITWLRLPAEAPGAEVSHPAPVSREVWQLMAPVMLPGHLDRDALLVGSGGASLQPLGGVRWAEPLRDVVPRLLRADLTRAWGAPVWTAPLPPGVRPTRQLRVEFSALDVTADGRGVQLQARWSLADALGATPPQVGEASFVTPASGADADALASAHRRALQQLAQRIVAAAR